MSVAQQTLSISLPRQPWASSSAPIALEASRAAFCEENTGLRRRVVSALSSLSSLGYVALNQIECQMDGRRIILLGSVSSYHLKQLAQTAALRVAGRYRVENRIVVTKA